MYSKKSNGWLKHLDFVLVDLIVMQIVYIVSYVIRHGLENPYDRTYYQVGALVILVTGVVFATLSDNYRNILKRSWLKELKASIIYVSALVIVLALYLLLSQTTFWYSRTVFVLLAILGVPAVYFGRLVWKKIVLAYRKKNGYSKKRMILVSLKDDFTGVKQRIEQKSLGDIEISGAVFFDDSTAEVGKKYDDVPVVGSLNDFTDNIVTDLVDEVMFVLPKGGVVPESLLQDLLNMGITSHVSISELYDNERGMKTIEKVGRYDGKLENCIQFSVGTETFDGYRRCACRFVDYGNFGNHHRADHLFFGSWTNFLLAKTCRSKRANFQNLQIPQHVSGCRGTQERTYGDEHDEGVHV